MKKFIILILLIKFSFYNSQNCISYYNLANKAEYELFNGSINVAEKIFSKLDKKNGLTAKDNFYLGYIKSKKGDTLNAYKCFVNSILKYGSAVEWIGKYQNGSKGSFKVPSYQLYKLKRIQDSMYAKKDFKLQAKLNYFDSIDQLNRSYENDYIDIKGDSVLQVELLAFMKKNGIPNVYLYGDMFHTTFLHVYNDYLFKEYEKFLYEEVKKGNLDPYYYCSMVDRYLYSYNKNETKFESYRQVCKDEKCKAKVEKNRKKIGLSSFHKGPNLWPI